jgi:predicted nuclease of predicted toxin-antitoxin system
MFFLVDRQLPPRLCVWLRERGHDALHVDDIPGGSTMPDRALWQRAGAGGWIIISRDYDFRDLAASPPLGPAPKVLHISIGNCTNRDLFACLSDYWDKIEAALGDSGPIVTLFRSGPLSVLPS